MKLLILSRSIRRNGTDLKVFSQLFCYFASRSYKLALKPMESCRCAESVARGEQNHCDHMVKGTSEAKVAEESDDILPRVLGTNASATRIRWPFFSNLVNKL